MGSVAEKHGWTRGAGCPVRPGVFEIYYMGRSMLVSVEREEDGKLLVYGVPGHKLEGLPISDFNMYCLPRSDDSRRTAASNLGEYDRALSRMIAGLTALRAALGAVPGGEIDALYEKWGGSQFDIHDIDSENGLSLETAIDREGVKRAVEERLAVWDREDHEAIPLPSEGLGSPPKGKDLHGRDV